MTSNRQTAYSSDCTNRPESSGRLRGWDPKIAELFGLGHQFLALEYSEPGYLYRGGVCNLSDLLQSGDIGHFEGDQSFVGLERELGIYLISQDFSDAYSVARFWERPTGGYIAVFKSACFNRELAAGRAAVLGFAEPGVVFRYPFLTRPLTLSDLDFLIVSDKEHEQIRKICKNGEPSIDRTIAAKIISPEIEPEAANNRRDFERALNLLLAKQKIESARAMPSVKVPRAK